MDYYSVLGISKDASESEIKRAFHKLSLKHHPDKSGGDSEKFKELNEAYSVLSNAELRQKYDNPNQFSNINNTSNHNDLFTQFFSGMGGFTNININGQNINISERRGPSKKSTHHHNIKVSLRDIHNGIKKNLKISIVKNCKSCNVTCTRCNGLGIIMQTIQAGPFIQQVQMNCNCKGGLVSKQNQDCTLCEGKTTISEEKIISLDVPICAENGYNIIFPSLGEQPTKSNEEAGDLVINILIENDPYFERENNNLIFKTKLTLVESITGKNITVPHFDEPVTINTHIFGILNPNRRYHLKGKGLGKSGDLIFQFEIEYPEKTFDNYDIQTLNNVFKNVGI